MAHFDTGLVLEAITHQVLADHETNRQIIELMEDTRGNHPMESESNRVHLVQGILELALRQMASSQHGRDLVVGLVDRFMDEARADLLARYELTVAGFTDAEIEETLAEFPEVAGKYMHPRPPTRRELDEAGAI